MTADSSTPAADHRPNSAADSPKTLPSPWSQVVRAGIEPDSVVSEPVSGFSDPPAAVVVEAASSAPATATVEGSDGSNDCNAGGVVKVKSAWSKPSANGVVEGESFQSPVMGAASWPALSESTRPGAKSPAAVGSVAVSQAPVVSQPQQKNVKHNSNSHSNPNHARQRSNRRGGNASGASASYTRPPPPPPVPSLPPMPPPFPVFDMYGNLVPAVPEPLRAPFKGGNWSARPVDQSLNRHPGRKNNFSSRPVNNNGYGGSRDHHGPRSPAAARDVNVPHQMGPAPPPPFRGFIRPPFFLPQGLRPYGVPMGYELGVPYVYYPAPAPVPYRGGPLPAHGAPASSLHDDIRKQIEYYFSDDNLVKDNYLRSHMDEEGWVAIKLIADFRRVQALTNDIQMLLSSLRDSSTVEVQSDKVRRRGDWKRWIHIRREATESSVEEASLQKLTLEDNPTNEKQVLANGDASIEDPSS